MAEDLLKRITEAIWGNGHPGLWLRVHLLEQRETFDVDRMQRMETRQEAIEQLMKEQQRARFAAIMSVIGCLISSATAIIVAVMK